MATRLTSLRLTKIDRVGRGAQPDAHITLVKRHEQAPVAKLMDPASITAMVAAVREDFNELQAHDDDGNYLCLDAVYDGYVIACTGSEGDYYRFDYTLGDDGEYSFGAPTAVTPTVSWSFATDNDTPTTTLPPGDGSLVSVSAADPALYGGYQVQPMKNNAPVSNLVQTKKEATVPTDIATLDLSALDDATREAIAGLAKERDDALAAATIEPTPAPEPEADLEKALAAATDPNVKAVLKAQADALAELRKQATADRERSDRLEKADRARVFKARAEVLKSIAPHAGGADELATLLDSIDKSAGSEEAAKVEAMLTAANAQIGALVSTLTEKGHSLHVVAEDSVDGEVEKLVKAVMTADPTINVHKARVQVLESHPELAAKALSA